MKAPAVLWRPHPGPQTRFLASSAYEVLFGGAAGGGKSDCLLIGSLRQVHHPQYRGLILRRTFPELRELMDRALGLFRQLGARWHEQQKRWTFPSGATVEFGYCEAYADVMRYQGQQYTYIAWDELGQCPEERMWTYLMSRNRTASEGLHLQMRASANPGGPGHAWLRRRFVVPCGTEGETIYRDPDTSLTRAYVPARVSDNPTLMLADPGYVRRLQALPETTRRQLLDGDWSAGTGMALEELDPARHMVDAFDPPPHWTRFAALDWGFSHPWAFAWGVADEDGNAYVCDTITGRRMLPWEIAERIASRTPDAARQRVEAGHDCWADIKARGENTPTIAEQMRELGVYLTRANISRKAGLNNLRNWIKWRGCGPEGGDRVPALRWMDTPGNRRALEQLQSVVVDPDDPEDALKVDADPDSGEGGDDIYDCTRYLMASRPWAATALPPKPVDPWDPAVLRAEEEWKRHDHQGEQLQPAGARLGRRVGTPNPMHGV